jgi:catechol 2,3-dioxygenase-like lactoylglutathione lyase family enzyme
MKYSGINHVALATNNMDRTIRFWRDLLGLRLIAGISDHGTRQYFFEITKNVMVSFFEWPDVEPVQDKDAGRPVKGPFAFDHICFEVEGPNELWALKDRLEAADVWVTEVMDNGFIHSMFATDPNNIQLEFCYSIEEINLSANPRIIDPEASAVTEEGFEPQHGKWPDVDRPTPPDDRKIYPGVLKALVNEDGS